MTTSTTITTWRNNANDVLRFRPNLSCRRYHHLNTPKLTLPEAKMSLPLPIANSWPLYSSLLGTCLALILVWLLLKVCAPRSALTLGRKRRVHTWVEGGIWHPLYCVVCETLLIVGSSGICCADCGIASCEKRHCVRNTEKRFPCKARTQKIRSINPEETHDAKEGW